MVFTHAILETQLLYPVIVIMIVTAEKIIIVITTAALSCVHDLLGTVLQASWALIFSYDGHHITASLTYASYNVPTMISLPLNRGMFLVPLKLSRLLRLPCQ